MRIKLKFIAPCLMLLLCAMTCEDPIEPSLSIHHIETVHINNEKDYSFVSEEPIKKEAYMIGLMYFIATDYKEEGYDKHPILTTEYLLDTIERVEITADQDFSENFPVGSDISSCFIKTTYKPDDITESYVLRKVPQPGIYTFSLRFYCTNGKVFEAKTSPIELY